MKTTSSFNADPLDPEVSSKFYFNVLIVYDTPAAAVRARVIFERLLDRFWDDFLFQCDLWRVDVLDLPAARQQFEWAGRVADLIIVSAEGSGVSGPVEKWLKRCASEKTSATAFVGLFEHQTESNEIESAMREFLKPVAKGLGFFVHEINPHRRWDLDDRDDWPPPHRLEI